MQKIEYKEKPTPHVVVKDFLSIPASRECLEEAQWLEPMYEVASIYESTPNSIMQKGFRQNKVVYMDEYYHKSRLKSNILQHVELAIQAPPLLAAFDTFPNLFPIITQTTHMEAILSSYGKCDFLGWHIDMIPLIPARRILTGVLHWNTEPQQYEGGELILSGETIEDQLAYTPVHNTAIFFESYKCVHAVNEMNYEGEFKDSRFSLNLWLGFEGHPKTLYNDSENFTNKYR